VAAPVQRNANGFPRASEGHETETLFLFFSNSLGCGGSLLVSAIATLILLILFGVIELG
jgi:hypothetical protein